MEKKCGFNFYEVNSAEFFFFKITSWLNRIKVNLDDKIKNYKNLNSIYHNNDIKNAENVYVLSNIVAYDISDAML